MKTKCGTRSSLVLALTLVYCIAAGGNYSHPHSTKKLKRSDFPADFLFGAASAAYQYEGAVREGGRGPSIWDTFTHQHPEKIPDHSNGDVAEDFYHRYKDDIRMLKDIGMNVFRFSISWSRIIPDGKICNGLNLDGVHFYNNVIDELVKNDIKPFVTLFHWDVPQALEEEYGGFLNSKIVNDFRDYVDICFNEFGDRVKYWMTVNEPFMFTTIGYKLGIGAPGRCSKNEGNCTEGNSATEPYIVGHNLLLAHAAAVDLYKSKYQSCQKREIGVVEVANWYMDRDETDTDFKVSNKAMDRTLGWFLHPLVYGDYPSTMNEIAGKHLPKFSALESEMLKGSYDFIGINYYLSAFASPTGEAPILKHTFVYPKGIRDLVLYIQKKYNNPVIYITENGLPQQRNPSLSHNEARKDNARVRYYKQHLSYLQKALKEDANVKGHMAWSILDDFEWFNGYTVDYGLIYVDRRNGLKRYPKLSAKWYKKFLN